MPRPLSSRIRAWFNMHFRIKRIESQLGIKAVELRDKTLTVLMEHPNFPLIAQEIVRFYQKAGGINYVEMKVFDPATMEEFAVLVQRTNGLTPHQKYEAAQQEIARLQEVNRTLVEALKGKK